ncbi:MAG: hypothetical protein IJ666_01215 [Ruminococcus sp.]|nr:hypothetical protein [Ruminococcus sp.]
MGMKAKDFNYTLPVMAQTQILDLDMFQKAFDVWACPDSTQMMISEIKSAEINNNCAVVEFKSGSKIIAYYDGHYEKFNKNGKLQSTGGFGTTRGVHKHTVKLKVEGCEMHLERFILIACDVARNEIALSYKGWEANVMDGSASEKTAKYLGIPTNFKPDNLEWCLKSDNVFHGSMIKKLYEITNHVYRFSANDKMLKAIYQTRRKRAINNYCKTFYKRIR